MRQAEDLGPFGVPQGAGEASSISFMVMPEGLFVPQGFFPASLELPPHQSVLGLDRVILPGRSPGLVTGPLQAFAPLIVELPTLLFDVGQGGEAGLERRGRHRRQDLLGGQIVEEPAGDRLAEGLGMVRRAPRTVVAKGPFAPL